MLRHIIIMSCKRLSCSLCGSSDVLPFIDPNISGENTAARIHSTLTYSVQATETHCVYDCETWWIPPG